MSEVTRYPMPFPRWAYQSRGGPMPNFFLRRSFPSYDEVFQGTYRPIQSSGASVIARRARLGLAGLQNNLAHKKTHPPRTLM